jgi:hypothetical protein
VAFPVVGGPRFRDCPIVASPRLAMSTVTGYLAAALLPVAYTELPDFIVLRWRWMHWKPQGRSSWSSGRSEKVAQSMRWPCLRWGLAWLIRWTSIDLDLIGLRLDNWIPSLVVGFVAGFAWLGLYVWLLSRVRPSPEMLAKHQLLQRPAAYWIPIFCVPRALKRSGERSAWSHWPIRGVPF